MIGCGSAARTASIPSPVTVLVASTSTVARRVVSSSTTPGGRDVELRQHHDRARAALPGDDDLAFHARERQPIGGRGDQHEVEVGGEHLAVAFGPDAGRARTSEGAPRARCRRRVRPSRRRRGRRLRRPARRSGSRHCTSPLPTDDSRGHDTVAGDGGEQRLDAVGPADVVEWVGRELRQARPELRARHDGGELHLDVAARVEEPRDRDAGARGGCPANTAFRTSSYTGYSASKSPAKKLVMSTTCSNDVPIAWSTPARLSNTCRNSWRGLRTR